MGGGVGVGLGQSSPQGAIADAGATSSVDDRVDPVSDRVDNEHAVDRKGRDGRDQHR